MSSDTGQQISPITFGNGWKTASPINCEDLTEAVQTSGKTENMTDSCKEFVSFCYPASFKNRYVVMCICINPFTHINNASFLSL